MGVSSFVNISQKVFVMDAMGRPLTVSLYKTHEMVDISQLSLSPGSPAQILPIWVASLGNHASHLLQDFFLMDPSIRSFCGKM